ncbi:LytR family transcriptional regulator [Rhodococcus sp. ABRD24]|uniref:envelope integrity protein Cei n=1 Tax=Rhodococcus sp. ABRD24 TaxID=2507582 RepID=UPI00103B8152|nr:envelope integrity protein Cei [Rhodococcus sp. ABRD24]QBJ98266.1 LytR family transcriptional regulator [Rhodococcus sp. ABRD24]
MVSLITDGSSTDDQGRPFRRRRALPVISLISVLALVCMVVWIRVLTEPEVLATTVHCNPPVKSSAPDAPPAQPLGEVVSGDTLRDVEPAALSSTQVRVFNGNGERGQAAHVAAQLSDYGFASAPDVQAGNDPVYIDQNLRCQGQIRFGPNGLSAASSVWLLAPCAELVQDERTDRTVDFALGTYFKEIAPNSDAEEVLRSLKDPLPGAEPAPLDMQLLDAARTARC